MSGYGAVLLGDNDETLGDLSGGMGPRVTVFQAECQAIIEGLNLANNKTNETLHILVDNQAVVKSLGNSMTDNASIKL